MSTGRRLEGTCPVCDRAGHLKADLKPHTRYGYDEWFYFCVHCGATLPDLIRATGIEQRFWEVPVGPPAALFRKPDHPAGGGGSQREPEPLPSAAWLQGCAAALQSRPDVLDWLADRGLAAHTLAAYGVGYGQPARAPGSDYSALTLPVPAPDERREPRPELENVRYRFWPDLPVDRHGEPIKVRGLAGRGMALYPASPTPGGSGLILLVEGELDALLGRQHGLPTYTSTGGTSWAPAWNPLVKDRRVAVLYDAGSTTKVQRRAQELTEAGADAWAVDLPLDAGEDLTDWFAKYGKPTRDLWKLIRASRT